MCVRVFVCVCEREREREVLLFHFLNWLAMQTKNSFNSFFLSIGLFCKEPTKTMMSAVDKIVDNDLEGHVSGLTYKVVK